MKNLIFLDFDGVLNCQVFYDSEEFDMFYQDSDAQPKYAYHKWQCSPMRIEMLNELCEETDSVVVVSASLRASFTTEELQELFDYLGGTFKVIGKTGHTDSRVRGVEIKQWLEKNCMELFGVHDHDFYRYAIIDDDTDMLLNQQDHFFHVDSYAGLTPNVCYRIKRYFNHKTF